MMLWLIAEDKDGVFNVGGESRVSIRDLAELITSMCGVDLQVPQARGSGSPGAPDDVWLSLQKIREAGYNGRLTPLPEGLRNTIEWQRQHLYPNEVTA